ncbi:MAG TPA: universal stress protein [Methylocella sp.]|nr:universal stress protein [Methylocella sp.]
MQIKSVFLGLSFDEITPDAPDQCHAAERYAVALCSQEQAHLSVFMATPTFQIPSAEFIPLTHAFVDEINAKRRAHAEDAEKRITSATTIAGVTAEFHLLEGSYSDTRDRLAAAARLSDIVILARPTYGISVDRDVTQAMLFTSGRPVIAVPPLWDREPSIQNVLVAWDGGARAARAVGDAMPLLTRAGQIEILCVSSDVSKSIDGADLAAHLARHCKRVRVTALQKQHGDVAKALCAHAAATKADLLVMGAYAHSRLLEMVLGGVTSAMLAEAELPVFLSH